MRTILIRMAVGAVVSGLLGGIAAADEQKMDEITVQGTRTVTTKSVGHTSVAGIRINDVSLSYGVVIAGLDLASHAGFLEAEQRVKDVAETACKELAKRYPDGSPSDAECAKAAADKAMIVVNGWAARASKASAK
jgi:UrcA family protein